MSRDTTKAAAWFAELRRRKVIRVAVVYAVVAWLLIQIAGETFGPIGLPDWTQKLVIVLALLGFPLACALAWALDVTPRGIERATAGSSDTTELVVGRLPGSQAPSPAAPSAARPSCSPADSVAILPFADMSPEKDQEYFCDGIAEEIINTLRSIRGLRIAARTSAFQFKARPTDVREIGRTLGVGAVLEGSVRKAGDHIRVTAQLVGAADGYHLWSESFDRRLEDVFAIQTEIAQEILRALRLTLSSGEAAKLERGGTASTDAYEYYLRARALLREESDTAAPQAAQLFRRSLQIDPEFALAYAGLAEVLAASLFWHPVKDQETISSALDAIQRAEQLRPGLAEVMASKGALLSAQRRHDEATAAFEEAIERAPNLFEAWYLYGRHAFSTGDNAKAVRLFQRASELDATAYKPVGFRAMALENLGQTERSFEAAARAGQIIDHHLELYPEDVRALNYGAVTHARTGHRERAIELVERALALRPTEFTTLYNAACAYARLGEPTRALDLLERSVDTGWSNVDWIGADPDLNSLRDDPRFRALLERVERRS